MTIHGRFGAFAVAAALAAAGAIATGGNAWADDCHTSATCGYSGGAELQLTGNGQGESCNDMKCLVVGTIDPLTADPFNSNPNGAGTGMPPPATGRHSALGPTSAAPPSKAPEGFLNCGDVWPRFYRWLLHHARRRSRARPVQTHCW
ncbi:hypothetical protein ACFQ2K_51315 [Streptomyces sanglieri]|uniref:Secreted protein n=1 Tax=Streptomyces sanglieri TaxID=193460 RepID=A0ABW2X7X5_9ACTN